MEFTKENWENAPREARLQYRRRNDTWENAHLIGYMRDGTPAVELPRGCVAYSTIEDLRIILPKRKVTVQLWRDSGGGFHPVMPENSIAPVTWTLLGEHTFEIEGE